MDESHLHQSQFNGSVLCHTCMHDKYKDKPCVSSRKYYRGFYEYKFSQADTIFEAVEYVSLLQKTKQHV